MLKPLNPTGDGGEDLLRLEYFGGLYYSRRTAAFTPVPPPLTNLLLAAREERAIDVLARAPALAGLGESQSIELLARWRAEGWLDEDFRCRAQLVPRRWNEKILSGPLATQVQLTQACNLRCRHCYVAVSPRAGPDELSSGQLRSVFRDLEWLGAPVVILAGGEPMLRSDFWEVLDALSEHRLDAWLCTNGTLVDDEAADRLAASALRGCSVSLDGPEAATHDALRGEGRFAQACRGLQALVRARVRGVQIRVTVGAHNAAGLAGFASLSNRLGVEKVVFKPFRRTGAASAEQRLELSLADWAGTVDAARSVWPTSGCSAEFGDGLSGRAPSWTEIIPEFGCVGGNTAVTVTAQGALVACPAVLSGADWRLTEHSFPEAWRRAPTLKAWRELQGNERCRGCEHLTGCGGGCRARAVAVGASLDAPDPWSYCSKALTSRTPPRA